MDLGDLMGSISPTVYTETFHHPIPHDMHRSGPHREDCSLQHGVLNAPK